ncbi:morphogenic membrane protein MmpB [Streptomyces sp. NPDC058646]
MLWSDPKNEPPEDMRDAQAMIRRLTVVIAVAMLVVVYVLGGGTGF